MMTTNILLTFPTSTSPRFAVLLDLAHQLADAGAQYVVEERTGKGWRITHRHIVRVSSLTPPVARLLVEFDRTARGLTGVTLSLAGHAIPLYQAARALDCYLQSHVPSDWRAHCWVSASPPSAIRARLPLTITVRLSEDPLGLSRDRPEEPPYWLFPCRLALQYYHSIDLRHPASVRAQVEAALAQAHCQWCPRLQDLDTWELYQWGRVDLEEGSRR